MKQMNVLLLCLCVVALVTPDSISANTVEVKPLFSVNLNYSDNILFSENQAETDLITTVSGGLAIRQKTEKMNASLEANLNKLLYKEFTELNSLDNFFSGSVDYKLTQQLGINASCRYKKDSKRDEDIETTGLLVSGDRHLLNLSISSNYLFSETIKGDISFKFGTVKTDESNQNEDNDQYQIDISFSKNLSQWFRNTTGLLNLSYLQYISEVASTTPGSILTPLGGVPVTSSTHEKYDSDIFQISTGFSREFSSKYNIYCMLGGSYARTHETLAAGQQTTTLEWETMHTEQKDDIWGGVLSTGINYTGLYYNMGLFLSQDMRGASGTNGAVQRSSVSGKIHRKVTENLTLIFNASCYLNQNKRKEQSDTGNFTMNLQPGFKYKFNRDFNLSGGYRFTSVRDREDQVTRTRNMIYLISQKEFEL